jgi:hypothetical protein
MNPQNGLVGDAFATSLPQTPVATEAMDEVRRKAKYSRSSEYAELRAKAQERIDFYRGFLPNGMPIGSTSREELAGKWELANILIAEFLSLFSELDGAEAVLKETYGS